VRIGPSDRYRGIIPSPSGERLSAEETPGPAAPAGMRWRSTRERREQSEPRYEFTPLAGRPLAIARPPPEHEWFALWHQPAPSRQPWTASHPTEPEAARSREAAREIDASGRRRRPNPARPATGQGPFLWDQEWRISPGLEKSSAGPLSRACFAPRASGVLETM